VRRTSPSGRRLRIAFLVAGFLVACWGTAVGAIERPDGWDAVSHSNEAAPGYDVVFAQGVVQRIDFEIAPGDWQAMLEDLNINFSSGPGEKLAVDPMAPPTDGGQFVDPKAVPPHIAVCIGKSEGDPVVLVDPSGRTIEGACAYDPKGQLVFIPDEQHLPLENRREPAPGDDPNQARGFPTSTGLNPIYVEATCRFNGRVWEHVGIRFKGNSSLRDTARSGVLKIPFHLEFDHFEDAYPEIDDQRLYGFKDLSLSNGFRDPTLVREKTTNDLFRAAGVPCAVSAFYRVYIDYGEGPRYFGLYTMTEIPGDPMLHLLFGNSGGNLYKPEGDAATFAYFDESAFHKKSNVDEADWGDIAAVIEALHDTSRTPQEWRASLEDVFNVQTFLRWLAADTVLGNWDTYSSMPHNFYLYTDEDDDRVHWIPWDNNEAMSDWYSPLRELTLRNVSEEWPLIRQLADDPIYYACYLNYVREVLDAIWDVATLQDQIRENWTLIQPYVTGEMGEVEGFTLLRDRQEFTEGLAMLLDYVGRRHQEVEQFLAQAGDVPQQIAITEIFFNPSSDQGSDDTHEFLELTNLGSQAVSLDGWRFADGIEHTFPAGTWIEPGACLVLAKDGETYAQAPCEVQQWADGKLANDGERLALVDTNGVCVDVVVYDDDDPWDESADGEGHSLVLIDALKPNDLVLNWQASEQPGGSPGWLDP